MHWNANSIKNKEIEFLNFVKKKKPHIISLNETKLGVENDLTIDNYHTIRLDRNSHGGGVAILIDKNFKFEQTNLFDKFGLELISIKIHINNSSPIHFITWYLPPSETLPNREFFRILGKLKKSILTGDLNCKSKSWFCDKENPNGEILREFLSSHNISVIKNTIPTHISTVQTLDILDLILTSPNLLGIVKNLKIHSSELSSDHFPITFQITNHTTQKPDININQTKINYEKVHLEIEEKLTYYKDKIAKLNFNYQNKAFLKIHEYSLKLHTRVVIKKVDNINLPKEIITLINAKKDVKKQLVKYKLPIFRTRFNFLNKLVKKEICKYKNEKNQADLNKLADMKASETSFWKLLHKMNGTNKKKKIIIPYLLINGEKIYDNNKKAESFGNHLEKIFVPYEDTIFDNNFKTEVNTFVESEELFNYDSEKKYSDPFTLQELENTLDDLKIKSSTGPDDCPNKIFKNLGNTGKQIILNLANHSYLNNVILDEWKTAKIIMIPKTPNDSHNINNYRPISLTNTIIKIIERLVKRRLEFFLEKKKVISKYQSGFRKKRSPIDNIFYFMQKSLIAFDQNHKVGGIVYDIEKAFDKVWHEGLLIKLHQMKVPKIIGIWLKNFLKNRKFFVEINGIKSILFNIETGVPQGAILSSYLFSLFINDIPLKLELYRDLAGLLYADDLFSFYSNSNTNRIQAILQRYLNKLEEWLRKWRLKIAPHKCSYNIYQKYGKCEKLLNLSIFGQKINRDLPKVSRSNSR